MNRREAIKKGIATLTLPSLSTNSNSMDRLLTNSKKDSLNGRTMDEHVNELLQDVLVGLNEHAFLKYINMEPLDGEDQVRKLAACFSPAAPDLISVSEIKAILKAEVMLDIAREIITDLMQGNEPITTPVENISGLFQSVSFAAMAVPIKMFALASPELIHKLEVQPGFNSVANSLSDVLRDLYAMPVVGSYSPNFEILSDCRLPISHFLVGVNGQYHYQPIKVVAQRVLTKYDECYYNLYLHYRKKKEACLHAVAKGL